MIPTWASYISRVMSHYSTSTVSLEHGTSVPNILVKEHMSPKDHATSFQNNSWNLYAQVKQKVLKGKGLVFNLLKKWVRWNRCLPSSDSVPTQALGSSGLWSRSCYTPIWFSSPLGAPSSSWVSVYVPSGKFTRIHAYALIIVNLDGDCVHISKLTYLTSPNRNGVWLKFKNRTKTWFQNLNTLISITFFNYLKQAFQP
jgi:hypothetical protein